MATDFLTNYEWLTLLEGSFDLEELADRDAGGRLLASDGELLPFNEAGLENAGSTDDTLLLAGDVRANENVVLTSVQDFSEISSEAEAEAEAEVVSDLKSVYSTVDEIDVWVGGLPEDHVDGGSVGELFSTIIVDQFERLRSGDVDWYQDQQDSLNVQRIDTTALADVIERNSGVAGLPDDLFFVS